MTLAIIVVALPGLKPLLDRSTPRSESSVENIEESRKIKE